MNIEVFLPVGGGTDSAGYWHELDNDFIWCFNFVLSSPI